MPPSKRTKRSSARSQPIPVSKNNADGDPLNVKGQDTISNESSTSTPTSIPNSLKPIDPALLDEEEVPGASDEKEDGITKPEQTPSTKPPPSHYATGGYNALKSFKGQIYSGMAIGGSHTWNYDQGVWKETKEEPDLWKIDYRTDKRRARKAPTGSGAPVGTEYHWFIVGHQYVKKTDANTYETHLVGSKYKLAHKGASSNSWSIPTVKGQREREIELLDDAKRRVQGLPPVLAGEKVRVEKREKGQQKLDALFAKAKGVKSSEEGVGKKKRKRDDADEGEGVVMGDDELHEE